MESLEIVYQDGDCIAINKPPGLLVHRTSLDTRATEFAMQILRDQIGRLVYPVHRLDRPTSGILLFALSSECAKLLVEQFVERTISKTYVAFVRGFSPDEGSFESALKDKPNAFSDTRLLERERDARTDFRTTARYELPFSDGRHPTSRYSLMEIIPRTGRRHQIRRHLKRAAHPIVGDTTHGDHRHNKRLHQRFGLSRMLLAATKLEFEHPRTGQELVLTANRGGEFDSLLGEIGENAT